MKKPEDRVKDEIASVARGMSPHQYARFLRILADEVATMAGYAAQDVRPAPSMKLLHDILDRAAKNGTERHD